jgi:hypothetical protein
MDAKRPLQAMALYIGGRCVDRYMIEDSDPNIANARSSNTSDRVNAVRVHNDPILRMRIGALRRSHAFISSMYSYHASRLSSLRSRRSSSFIRSAFWLLPSLNSLSLISIQ